MNTSVKLFGKDPALVGAFLQSLLAALLGLGIIPGLNSETAALISVAGAAVFGGYAAFAIKQNVLPAVVAAFQALAAVAVGFGLGDVLAAHGYDATLLTGLGTAVLTAGLGLFLRTQADPKAGSPAAPTPVEVTVTAAPSVAQHSADDEPEFVNGESLDGEHDVV
jgi:hypothetical protein